MLLSMKSWFLASMALRLRRLFPSMLSRFPNMIQYRTVLNFTGCSLPYSASSKGGGYYGKLIQFGLRTVRDSYRTVRDSYVSPVGGCGHRIFVHFPAKLGAGNNLGFHPQPREIFQRRLFSSKVGAYPHFEEGSSGVVGTQKSGSLKKKRRYGARKKGGADRGGTRLAMSKGKNAQTTKASLEQFVEAQPDIGKMDSAHLKKHEGCEVKSGDQLGKIKNKKTRPAKRSIKKKRLSTTGKEVEGKPSSGTTSQSLLRLRILSLLHGRVDLARPVLHQSRWNQGYEKEIDASYPPLGKSVVVVESLTKAQLIQGYLGDMFEVLPSYGHVRDLAARSGSVRPDDDFSMVWEVPSSAWTPLKSIMVALNGAENLILASDPDREGEAIAWHITEMLRHQDSLLDNITIARVVFHEITETSIKNALMNPRDIDANLVNAHLARRALEYLIGFKISPLLWQKLPGCQMAGRVQSVALALLAQKLYEGVKLSENEATGLITYMRTDRLHVGFGKIFLTGLFFVLIDSIVSKEAAHDILSFVSERYGMQYALKCPRTDFQKVANSQESYEAIRPTNIRRLPSMLVGVLDNDCLKLYTLIWSRTMASQMESSITDMDEETALIAADFSEGDSCVEAYSVLPSLRVNDQVYLGKVELMQHSTEPPVRYSEGSLVKKLEELGIGRPSTYASVIKVLQDRNYLAVKNKLLFPEFRARMVTAFLSTHFSDLADCSFTADMETELDNVSFGVTEWKALLKDYWSKFNKHCDRAHNIRVQEVEKMLEKTLGDAIFSSFPDKGRTCPSPQLDVIGAEFLGCQLKKKDTKDLKYSDVVYFMIGNLVGGRILNDRYVAGNVLSDDEEVTVKPATAFQPRLIGLHPGSDEKIYLKQGPYGYYVQLGEDKKGHTPKRAPITQIKDVESISVEDAVGLLRFPITLGNHPEDGLPVMIKLSAFRYSVRHRSTMTPVPKDALELRSYLHNRSLMQYADRLEASGKPLAELLNYSTIALSSQFGMRRGHITRFTDRAVACGIALPPSSSFPARTQSRFSIRGSSKFDDSVEQSMADVRIKEGHVFKGIVASEPAEARLCGCIQPPPVVDNVLPYSSIENITVQKLTPEYKIGMERLVKSKAPPMRASELWKDKPAVLLCVRRPGCIMCRAEAHQLYTRKPIFDALGFQLIAVLHEQIEPEVKDFWPRYWGGVVILDKGMEFFKALGGGSLLKDKFITGFLFNPRAIANYKRAKAIGLEHNFRGEGEIKGGLFVVGRGRTGIAYQFIERNFGDWAPTAEIIEICSQLQKPQQPEGELL
ncbi:hypothetical protein QJS10_CPB17g00389 [Acorus calamus]|uniref:DNA topoisomerase n=1 Tax=Acorus calamus TaxID=4465 RepID=A0AAV9CTY9_ACOCL|nr:hypothetical protein QJS10_CPB17g00389 [Acorus calamus]